MKKLSFIPVWLVLLLLTNFQAFSQLPVQREKINFDRDWKFHLGHAADPAKDFNFKVANIFSKSGKAEGTAIDPKFDDKDWRTLDLPHDWAVELPFVNSYNFDVMAHGYKPIGGLFPQNSVGWYRKPFTIAKSDSGQRFAIQFDGVFRDAMVWVNGFYLGTNQSGYLGMNYDITDYINFDKSNVIVVRVDATQYEGWFYEGAGIYRHVWLQHYNNLHIAQDGVFVFTDVKGNLAKVFVETTIENQTLAKAGCTVETVILDQDGNRLTQSAAQPISLAVNEKKQVKQQVTLKSPRLWSLEDPYQYKVVCIVKAGTKIIDQLTTKLGVRTIQIDAAKGVILNGKHIKIKGVNCHQDHAGVGSALPDYLQYYRIELLKQLGVNAYRTSHNAPTPELLEACDSLGMLVLDETRLLNSSPEYMGQFERLIRRDRNHPSVFMWSIGNEEGYIQQNSVGKRLALSSIAEQKELDPTRTSTYAADLGNVFTGINEVIPVRGFNYRVAGIKPYHLDHPTQPIIGTEMGSTVTTRGIYIKDTINGYVPDQDITAPWWASKAEDWWPVAAENNWMMGGFVWTGLDYRGEPTPYQWPNINSHFGIMDVCGFPKNIYYYYQSWWTGYDVLHISPHWNWKGMEGQPIDVWVNTNADTVELFLNGKTLGKKEMPLNSHLQWTVPYEPGTLKAIAVKKGRILTTSIETTDEPFELMVTPTKTTLFADGRDVSVLNISVIDKKGREVPDAQNLVTFSLKGNAKIIGVGNGDPSSHEPDKCPDSNWQRKLFNGKCQLILQTGYSADILKLEAKSEGIRPASTEIHSILPFPAVKTPGVNKPGAKNQLPKKNIGKMLGADISFLPQLEDRGMKFYDKDQQKDAIEILKDHGFNYVRLRIFNNPSTEKGYSPGKGFCDLEHTKQMALRVKKAGLKLLLDFHYSDYWADPQQQNKPSAWEGMDFNQLTAALKDYTKTVLLALKAQGTLPDMVQIGNEINHGMVWPEGHIGNPDNLAALIKAGIEGVKEVDPSIIIMLHIALGGQNAESVFWLDNMFARGVDCDIIGLSYYPRWHGTLNDLNYNLNDLIRRYNKYVNVVEYSHKKGEVNDIAFNLPGNKGTGTFIWEPLSTWESVFDKSGKSNELLNIYDEISRKYLPAR
ncbi:MAG: beta-galactosidase GalA [Lentimicrobiaceae bacterium]|jgi:beta-galactosidase